MIPGDFFSASVDLLKTETIHSLLEADHPEQEIVHPRVVIDHPKVEVDHPGMERLHPLRKDFIRPFGDHGQ